MDPAERFQMIQGVALQTAMTVVLMQIPGGIAGFEIAMRQRIEFWETNGVNADPQGALDALAMADALDRVLTHVLEAHREMKPPRERR